MCVSFVPAWVINTGANHSEFDRSFFFLSFTDLLVRTESLFSPAKTLSDSSPSHRSSCKLKSESSSALFLIAVAGCDFVTLDGLLTAIPYPLVPIPVGAHGVSRYSHIYATKAPPSHWTCRVSYSKWHRTYYLSHLWPKEALPRMQLCRTVKVPALVQYLCKLVKKKSPLI